MIPLRAAFQDRVKRWNVAQRQPTGRTQKYTEQTPNAPTVQDHNPEDISIHIH